MMAKDRQLLSTLSKLTRDIVLYCERNASDYYIGRWEQYTADQDKVTGAIKGIMSIVCKIEIRSTLRTAENIFPKHD